MAISTQLRLIQLSGSFGNDSRQIRDDVAEGTDSESESGLAGSLSVMASAIKRINGGADFRTQAEGQFNLSAPIFGGVSSAFKIASGDNADLHLQLAADRGDDNGDTWQIKAGSNQTFALQNNINGSWQEWLKITPASDISAATSLVEIDGNLKLKQNDVQNSAGGVGITLSGDGTDVGATVGLGTGTVTAGGTGGFSGVQMARATGGTLTILAGADGTASDNLLLQGGDIIQFRDQYSTDSQTAGKITSNQVKLAINVGEWNSFGDSFGDGSSIIGAINAASSGSPVGVDSYVSSCRQVGGNENLGPGRGVVVLEMDAAASIPNDNTIQIPAKGGATPTATVPSQVKVMLQAAAAESGGFIKGDDTGAQRATRIAALLNGFEPRLLKVTFTGVPTATKTLTIKDGDGVDVVWTSVASGATGTQFNQGADANAAAANFASALQGDSRFQAYSDAGLVGIYQAVQPVKDAVLAITNPAGANQMDNITLTAATPVVTGVDLLTAVVVDTTKVKITMASDGAMDEPLNVLFAPNGNGTSNGNYASVVGAGGLNKFTPNTGGGNKDQPINLTLDGFTDVVGRTDVYLNGQLMVSGSALGTSAQPFGPNSEVDYALDALSSNTGIIFGFDLEQDDRVMVKVR